MVENTRNHFEILGLKVGQINPNPFQQGLIPRKSTNHSTQSLKHGNLQQKTSLLYLAHTNILPISHAYY